MVIYRYPGMSQKKKKKRKVRYEPRHRVSQDGHISIPWDEPKKKEKYDMNRVTGSLKMVIYRYLGISQKKKKSTI